MLSLFELHPHTFDFVTFCQHLFFDGLASAGGYYASQFCRHLWHRIAIATATTVLTTLAIVSLIG